MDNRLIGVIEVDNLEGSVLGQVLDQFLSDHPESCLYVAPRFGAGIWLNQVPYESAPVDCVECGNPVLPLHTMCAVVDGRAVTPLCPPCYERHLT